MSEIIEQLCFDETTQRYVLTQTAVESELGIDLSAWLNTFGDSNPSNVPIRFLKRVSMIVYNHVKKYSGYSDRINQMVNCSNFMKSQFTEALLNQVLYIVNNGDLGLQSGVNLKDGRAFKPEELRGIIRISPDTHDILLNAGFLYCGYGRSYL